MPPTIEEVIVRLREVFGPEQPGVEAPFLRWRIDAGDPASAVDLWLRCEPADPAEPCQVWVTRPDEAEPEHCEITTMQHLEDFISRITVVAREPDPEPVAGNVCPPER